MYLRCPGRTPDQPGKIHGEIIDQTIFEVKCRNVRCGAKSGVVVLHRFNLETGELIETKKFADPAAIHPVLKKKEA